MHMWGEGERPEPERLERGARARAPRTPRLAPRAARAGAARDVRVAGVGARPVDARRAATPRSACEIEPEHGLAEIVRSFVHAGHLPEWAFRRR